MNRRQILSTFVASPVAAAFGIPSATIPAIPTIPTCPAVPDMQTDPSLFRIYAVPKANGGISPWGYELLQALLKQTDRYILKFVSELPHSLKPGEIFIPAVVRLDDRVVYKGSFPHITPVKVQVWKSSFSCRTRKGTFWEWDYFNHQEAEDFSSIAVDLVRNIGKALKKNLK